MVVVKQNDIYEYNNDDASSTVFQLLFFARCLTIINADLTLTKSLFIYIYVFANMSGQRRYIYVGIYFIRAHIYLSIVLTLKSADDADDVIISSSSSSSSLASSSHLVCVTWKSAVSFSFRWGIWLEAYCQN